jgi:hypothetical protein
MIFRWGNKHIERRDEVAIGDGALGVCGGKSGGRDGYPEHPLRGHSGIAFMAVYIGYMVIVDLPRVTGVDSTGPMGPVLELGA